MSLEYQRALLVDINKDVLEANSNLKSASNEVNEYLEETTEELTVFE